MRKLVEFVIVILMIFDCSILASGSCSALYPIYDSSAKKYGYIDCHGKTIVQPRFNKAYDFSEGMGKVETGEKPFLTIGFVGLTGQLTIQPKFGDIGSFSVFSEDSCPVITESGLGFINRDGKTLFVLNDASRDITPPLESFSDGLALVYTDNGVKYVNKRGQMMLGRYFTEGSSFRNGLAVVKLHDKLAIIKTNGKFLIAPQNNDIAISQDGTIAIKRGPKWHYYTSSMKPLFSSHHQLSFSEGLAFFEEGSKWGVINRFGRVIVEPKYDTPLVLTEFSEGFGVVTRHGKQGAIDRAGRVRIPVAYDSLDPMKNGLMRFQRGNTLGYLRPNGRIIWQSNN